MNTLCVSEISYTINILGLFSVCQSVCLGRPEAHSERIVLHTSPRWSQKISTLHSTPSLSTMPWGMLGYAGFNIELDLPSTRKLFCHINNHTEKSLEAVQFEASFIYLSLLPLLPLSVFEGSCEHCCVKSSLLPHDVT